MWWWSARAGPPRPEGCCEGVRVRLPGVMRGAVEGVGVRGSAVMVRSGRLRVRRGSRDRWVGCRGRSGRRRERFRRPRPAGRPAWWDGVLHVVTRRRLARTSLDPRERTSSRRAHGSSDVLGGYPTISRTAAPDAAAMATRCCSPPDSADRCAPDLKTRASPSGTTVGPPWPNRT